MTEPSPVLGVFVGGGSTRMGTPKGALVVPGTGVTIVETLVACGREAGLLPVLVGDASQYASLVPGVTRLADRPADAGPLGGLNALLAHAAGGPVIAIACDMPFVEVSVLARLRDWGSEAAVVAARRGNDAPWEPMLARYDGEAVQDVVARAIEQGVRSFQKLFAMLDVVELPLDDDVARALQDWDTPDDLLSSRE